MPKGANSIILVITIEPFKTPTVYNYQNFKTAAKGLTIGH